MDLLLTDPPYNVDYQGTAGKIKNDNMEDTAFRRFLTDAFSNAAMVMKPGAPFYIWHADSEGYNFRGACKDAMLRVRQCLIWVKNSLVMGRQDSSGNMNLACTVRAKLKRTRMSLAFTDGRKVRSTTSSKTADRQLC